MSEKLLLCWEQVGEQGEFYVLDTNSVEAGWARASAGFYINGDDLDEDHAIYKLNTFLGGEGDRQVERRATNTSILGPFCEAVVCGFFL